DGLSVSETRRASTDQSRLLDCGRVEATNSGKPVQVRGLLSLCKIKEWARGSLSPEHYPQTGQRERGIACPAAGSASLSCSCCSRPPHTSSMRDGRRIPAASKCPIGATRCWVSA